MKNSQKGFIVPLLLVIIAVLVIGGGVYVYNNKKVKVPVSSVDTEVQATNKVQQQTNNQTLPVTQTNNSNLKTYTNTKQGYSFQYPEKLSLSTSGEVVNLSHSITFDNYDGGCDMKGDDKLSKTLGDFGLSFNMVSGQVNPPYVDGSYSKGILNGKWAYMGAEGCGQTSYYFPITGSRTLVITKNEIQILSPIVTPEVRAKVLAVPGVISYKESKVIFDQILSTFTITSKATYTYANHGFSIELPKGFVPKEEQSEGGPALMISLPIGGLAYVTNASFWEKYNIPNYTYVTDKKIGDTTFKVYTYLGSNLYWFKQGNVGYEFSVQKFGVTTDTNGLENLLKTFKFIGWPQS